ncbi:NAD(P)H-binding protein [Pseudoroseicyclus aestuarii]|uniref:Uncharacterized protein YbjT (DUF2867 family) n=1 Tax=Pseudoroseicyclus aestuarii TaxID=1795041 RepID=A0A318SUN6_9RHOB|nr:NAD(P)H-binding protein [Pseudoroseicyclus aestuarii]PYE85095.1 uncharacterized protein YbjT (DUF2867 family) [Pseudoroseicyclus aestuarii]
MIIVTGASGHLGRATVRALAARMEPARIVATCREPEQAADLQALGVTVRHGDFDNPGSLSAAFEGAEQVLIVSSNAAAFGGDPLAQHRAAIHAAKEAGARRVLYTSHMGAGAASAFPPMRDHAATESMLQSSGLAWCALRNGVYASSGVDFLGDAPRTGRLTAPEDGPVSWTAHADLAEAAAAVLADEGRFEGPTPPLVGAEALDLGGLCGIASDLLGREVRRETVAETVLREGLRASGVSEAAVSMVLGFYIAAGNGAFASNDTTLEELIGRRPVPMRDVMARALLRRAG